MFILRLRYCDSIELNKKIPISKLPIEILLTDFLSATFI
ncbi:hypothetical protein AB996_0354 [Lactococcus cremoris]|uniref:Uncharacterized protein n=1 Tax=Lactococcus lactis subsp. cremoris TaxID=1359 RepID=A0A166K7U5_LACLC|nr:hypothetical protein AB996_0354 [Lactococcus cremoris]